jgi:hypothetical protein
MVAILDLTYAVTSQTLLIDYSHPLDKGKDKAVPLQALRIPGV